MVAGLYSASPATKDREPMPQQIDSVAARLHPFTGIAYFLAALMMVLPLLDVTLNLGSLQFGTVRWRFGAIGLITGALLIPVFGLLLTAATAAAARHRRVLLLAVGLAALGGLIMLTLAGLFMLDALQVRNEVNAPMLRRFDVTVVRTVITQLILVAALAMLGRASWRTGRLLGREEATESSAADAMLLRAQ
jgi:hypothetical protein